MNVIPANPLHTTLKLTPRQRSLGRLVKLDIGAEPNTPAADLAGDIFHNLFGEVPFSETIPATRALNKLLMDTMINTSSYAEMKAHTTGNIPSAVMAGQGMFTFLQRDEVIQEAMKKAEEMQKAHDEALAKQAAAQHMPESPQKQQILDEARQAQEKLEQLQGEMEELTGQFKNDPVKQAGLASSIKQASSKASEMASLMAGWGMSPGEGIYNDPSQAMDYLAQMNKSHLREVARLAGRMKGYALSERRKMVPSGNGREVALTKELPQVFPFELAYLHPSVPQPVRASKMADLLEVGLLGWNPAGEKEEQGAFVAAVDVSGSMSGGRSIVAKAIALGLAQVAKMEGRPYILFSFGFNSNRIEKVTDKDGWEAHLRWASYQEDGGTNFDLALQRAEQFIREAPSAHGTSDCLFISDGEAVVSGKQTAAWSKLTQDTGTRLYYVSVANRRDDALSRLADRTIPVAELDETAGGEVSRTLVNHWR